MQLGIGYWSLPAVEKRIADLESRKPRKWKERLRDLKRVKERIVSEVDQTRLVKGWSGRKRREERYLQIKAMLKGRSYRDVGNEIGLSRQRVHQIIRQWK